MSFSSGHGTLRDSLPGRASLRIPALGILLIVICHSSLVRRQAPPQVPKRGVDVVQHNGYPELRVDGAPFFVHSAAFFYYRMPRDLWELWLNRYRAAGINTIDLYIPWNWHEPAEGAYDFDGHSNARRDLRGLLRLVAQKRFHLIARPGPEILNEWKNGGYPDWLLSRPEYKMDRVDLLEGRYPPLDNLNARDAEAAATGWLENKTHMRYAREWLTTVANELAPYSARRQQIDVEQSGTGTATGDPEGTLLFVQLGDDFALGRENRAGAEFWGYVQSLRDAVRDGGVDAPVFINPTDMRVAAAGSRLEPPIGVMGQWYLRPPATALGSETDDADNALTALDLSELEFFTEELKTQPSFPAAMVEFQAGWYAPADDDRPQESPPENTLLSSRLLIANGIQGLSYLPLQDTYTPAGFSVPWANRAYRWDAAFGSDGERQPRLRAVQRNGRLLDYWGSTLAASHKRADFGIIYPLGAYAQDQLQAEDIRRISRSVMQIERLAHVALLSSEVVDPQYQPVKQLLRDPILFLPTLEGENERLMLSETAQKTLVEYVREGGTLAVCPFRPGGATIGQLFDSSAASAAESSNPGGESAIRSRRPFGNGEVVESTKDFFSWIALNETFSQSHARPESYGSVTVLREILMAANVRPSVRLAGSLNGSRDLAISEIVSNDGSAPLGGRTGGKALLSVTNLSSAEPREVSLDVLPADASARSTLTDYLPMHITVPARDSLLLPIQTPLCASKGVTACSESIVTSGAELLGTQREGKTLELLLYVPARAEIRLHLGRQPSHILLEETRSEAVWTASEKELQVVVPRGAAPGFLRTLKIELPYRPDQPEPEKNSKPIPQDLDFAVLNSIRLPTGGSSFLRTYPPLVLLEANRQGSVLVQGENRDPLNRRDGTISIDGDLRGIGMFHIPAPGISVDKIRVRSNDKQNPTPAPAQDAAGDILLHSTIRVQSGKDDRTTPVVFLKLHDAGTTAYRYDFDRDGADEWVIENAKLRLIVSPESGGQAFGFIDKASGGNISTSAGLLRDAFAFTPPSQGSSEARPSGRWGLFNRPYAAEWLGEAPTSSLRLRYEAPDVFPAGARIEKTVQLEDENTLRVDYQVSLGAPSDAGTATAPHPAQAFVAINSFPGVASDEHPTQFCWKDTPGTATSTSSTADSRVHCEKFVRNAKLYVVPTGSNHVEIQTTGRPRTAFEWECSDECAQLTIEPKTFSALFRLQFPTLSPGGNATHYAIRIRVLSSQ